MGGARDAPWRLIGLCRTTHLVGAKRLGIVFRHARELRAVGDAEVGAVIARFGKHQNRAARLAVQRLDPLAPALSRLAHLAAKAQLLETRFRQAVAITRTFLDHAISKKVAQIRAVDTVRQAPRLLGGKLLHLKEGGMPWTRVVVDEMPEVLFVVYPDSDGNQYQIKTVPVEPGSFDTRKDLPAPWAGLRDQELAAVTGVEDSVFCHLNLFIGGARSFEGAVKLAELALAA